MLEAVEAAIIAVANNQSYQLDDMKVTRANLSELRQMRTELKSEIANIQGTRPRVSTVDLRGNFE